MYSFGVVTNRDDWVYGESEHEVTAKVRTLISTYNADVQRLAGVGNRGKIGGLVDTKIKWTRAVKRDLERGIRYAFDGSRIVRAMYRPFCQRYLYFSPQLNEMPNLMPDFFGEDGLSTNQALIFTDPTSQKPFMALATSRCPDMHLVGAAAGSVTMPLQRRGDSEDTVDNVTEWALEQFRKNYQPGRAKAKRPITKEAISHYVYGALHNPVYREKYALNLKREFPRIPLYPDFWQWADWGKELMELHIGYEEVTPYKLKRVETAAKAGETPAPKALLKADKEHGCILVDGATTLTGVPAEAWEYRLGNRSALEWILDQYKERKPKDPTIREKFNTYRFADHKEKVIDLLMRVTTVSVRTQEIVRQMAAL